MDGLRQSIVRVRHMTALEMADLEREGEPPIVLELSKGTIVMPGKHPTTGEPALFFYTPERVHY